MRAVQRMKCAIKNKMPMQMSRGRSAGANISTWIQMLLGLIVGIILIPIVELEVRQTNTTLWNFTGSSGAITLFRLLPFIFIAGVIIWFVGTIFGKW